jgi:putative ABC transport system permease protein
MLVSVAERTREIGIRKAVGATRRDVFSQFLVEAILVSSVGGVIGIVLGVAVSLVIMKFLNIPLIIATWAAVLALIVAVGVGIASGLYPSMRAASLDPVEALRYE